MCPGPKPKSVEELLIEFTHQYAREYFQKDDSPYTLATHPHPHKGERRG